VTPYYDDGKGIVIYNGDNVATMRNVIPDGAVDLVVTSPPYDNLRTYGGHQWDFEGVAAELWRVIKPGGVVVWVVADATIDGSETGTSFRQALRFMAIGFNLWDTMIWDKPWCQYGDTASRYAGTWEYMFVLSKDRPAAINILKDRKNETAGSVKATRTDRRVSGDGLRVGRTKPHVTHEYGPRKSIWIYAQGSETIQSKGISHPAIFPESLARDHILSWSNEGDTVLDPFGGSGTTAKMAKLMGRKSISVEINQDYCEIQVERLRQGVLDFGGDV
jgi:DNA modification methylase